MIVGHQVLIGSNTTVIQITRFNIVITDKKKISPTQQKRLTQVHLQATSYENIWSESECDNEIEVYVRMDEKQPPLQPPVDVTGRCLSV